MTETASTTGSRGITRETTNTFIAILMFLIVKGTLDVFFKNFPNYTSTAELLGAMKSNLGWGTLATFQLLVFLFTVIRFYWGCLRYNEEVPPTEGTPHLLLGLAGAVLLFSTFYVTGLVIRNSSLFYWILAIAHLIDFFWFLIAAACLQMPPEIKKIWNWYEVFDVATLVLLLLLMSARSSWPGLEYLWDGLSLASVLAIGIFDLKKFWAYYTKDKDWKQKTLFEAAN